MDRRQFIKRAALLGGAVASVARRSPRARPHRTAPVAPWAPSSGRSPTSRPSSRPSTRRRRDDGEPLLRPLARLDGRGPALPRGGAPPVRAEVQRRREAAADVHRARRHRREDRAAGRQPRPVEPRSAGATTTTPGTAGGRAVPSATAASSPRGPERQASRSATTSATTCRSRRSSPASSRRSTAGTRRCSARPTRTASTSTAAQSGNAKTNAFPTATGGYPWDTIWERLAAEGVDAGYYFTDLPFLALYGQRLVPFQRPIEQFFTRLPRRGRCRTSRSSTRSSSTETSTDDHPHADIRARAGVPARPVQGVLRVAAVAEGRLRRSPTTSGAASSTTSRRRSSPTTSAARTTSRTSARPGSGCRR